MESYAVRNYQDYADRTSEYVEHNDEIAKIEEIIGVKPEENQNLPTELSFTQEDNDESNPAQ